jgi:hypothetical protein
VRSPVYLASLVAALFALLPAVIRLYESIATTNAPAGLYLAWLAAWLLTALTVLWSISLRPADRRARIGLALCGGGMLVSLLLVVGSGTNTHPVVAVAAGLANLAVAAGAIVGVSATPTGDRLMQGSWAVAALGAAILAAASLFLSREDAWIVHVGLPGGSFLLGAGLSLALGHYEQASAHTSEPLAAASQEP